MKTFAGVILALAASLCAAQDLALKQFPARVELYAIPKLTISDSGFLKGDASPGKPVTVNGELRIAQGSGKLPVVVLIHGSSGVGPNIELWVRDLNAMGISTFVIDGFTGRGLTVVGPDQALLGRLNLILDASRGLDILARHPRVDASRVAMMGFSRGGQATLFASVKRFNEPDDYNPVAPCKAYVERLKAAGNDVELTEYPNAQHAFDNPLGAAKPTPSRTAQTVRHCRIAEEAAGDLVNQSTDQRFQYTDACVERDPHTGFDPEASEAARKAVGSFLKAAFKL